jgi:Txe/YoeB family toxin of Txe-Axe toxin-antitoxin module
MKPNKALLALICLFVSFSVQAQRLVLEDAISLTNSYHKDYSQYPNQLEFYKALNAEIKSTIDVLNGYVKITTKDKTCNCYSAKPLILKIDPAQGFDLANELYTKELKNLDTEIQNCKLTLESYKDVQYIDTKVTTPPTTNYYKVDIITANKSTLYQAEIKKNELEIKRSLCYLQFLMDQNEDTDQLDSIIQEIYDNFNKVFTGQTNSFTSFTNYTEKSLFAMTGSAIFNTVIEGLSKFIIDRVKKEAAATATNYYQRLINKIDTNYVNLMEGIFPTTIAMFNNYEAQDINSYIQSIKKAADEDLQNMVPNITNLVVEKKIKVPASIWDGTVLYQTLTEASSPYEFFRSAEKQNFETDLLDTVFDKAYVISELILVRKSNGTLTYAAPSYLDNYWTNDFFKKAYVGLGQAKYRDQWNFKAEDMTSIIELSSSFYKFSEAAADLAKAKAGNDSTYYSKIGYMADCAIDLTEMIKKTFVKDTTGIKKINKILDAFRFGNQVYKSIYRKNYLTTVNLVLTKLFEYNNLGQGYGEEIDFIRATKDLINANYLNKKKSSTSIQRKDLIKLLSDKNNLSFSIHELINSYPNPDSVQVDGLPALDLWIDKFVHTGGTIKKEFTTNTISMKALTGIIEINDMLTDSLTNLTKSSKDSFETKRIENIVKKTLGYFLQENKYSFTDEYNKSKISAATLNDIIEANKNLNKEIQNLINNNPRDVIAITQFLKDLEYRDSLYQKRIESQRMLYEIAAFISSVASVENSDDVKKIFENFALPVGSYTIKRKSKFSITLDAQPGILAGFTGEFGGKRPNTFAWGATVPVGFSFSWGLYPTQSNLGNKKFRNSSKLNKHSLSIFLPIIDLAAPVSFLVGANGTGVDSTITTDLTSMLNPINIFSPGIFFNWGLPNAPLTVFGGFQYNPQIINFDKTTGTERGAENGYRISIGLSFDIPIFRIYSTRSYKAKWADKKTK